MITVNYENNLYNARKSVSYTEMTAVLTRLYILFLKIPQKGIKAILLINIQYLIKYLSQIRIIFIYNIKRHGSVSRQVHAKRATQREFYLLKFLRLF